MLIRFATAQDIPFLTDDDRLAAAALAARGATIEPLVWTAPDDGDGADAVVIRSCWDYHLREREFAAWIDERATRGVVVINPPVLVQWNLHKGYILELGRRGVPVVPTVHVVQADERPLRDIMVGAGWDEVVVKPAVSLSAWQTRRIARAAVEHHAADFDRLRARGDVLVQRFIPEITSEGEWSLMFFGGQFSHAIRKRPRPGDFRVQIEHGGSAVAEDAPARLIDSATRVVDALPAAPIYARIDGVDVAGELLLMEAECIDPFLFFADHPPAATRFAEAVLEHLGAR